MHGFSKASPIPMEIDESKTANFRWVNKPVLKSLLLDDMENPANWQHHGVGGLSFTKERFLDGTQCLRLVAKTKMKTNVAPDDREHYGRPFGEVIVRRSFKEEDWSQYNRLSFWVYPTLPGFKVISMYAVLHNDGAIKIPDSYEREGLHFFLLKPDQWNHVVWEIASLPRERVTAVDIIYRMQGHEPGATDTVCFDIDRLELQKVEADHFEGWNVAPGRIAFSHTGYQTGTIKTAIASQLAVKEFSLVHADTNKVVLTKPIKTVTMPQPANRGVMSAAGEFHLMDFSELEEEGLYFIKAGVVETQPFRIDKNVWRGTIWKTLNFFFCERCGFDIPGIHGVCHQDWQCESSGKKMVINGGWHDAGDLSQGVWNTTEATYAMFHLAEKIKTKDPDLYEQLIDEAKWGLIWILKTRFGDGNRSVWATMDFWTDNIIGTFDDITFKAQNTPFANFDTAAAEAIAARVLKDVDPELSALSLNAAQEDWQFALDGLTNATTREGSRYFPEVQIQGTGALASIELFRATGNKKYAEKAFEQARVIMSCQQKMPTDWDIPLSGFFYTDPQKQTILRYFHLSQSQAPIVPLSELLQEFPDHAEWVNWYSTITLYSEYLMKITEFTGPYHMFPCSIYRIDESDEPAYREQVLNGIKLSEHYYLRIFPVWYVFRGNNSLILSDAKALSSLTKVRRNTELINLCQKQLEWVVGRNPFSQSLMYGEGYDYAPQYTAMSGDMVGSLPVGIQTSRDKDIPYWPVNNCYNYKEVWVQPSARWLWLMSDLSGPARIFGKLKPGTNAVIEFVNHVTGKTDTICIDQKSEFEAILPQGQYTVKFNGKTKSIILLPAEDYSLDLCSFYEIRVANIVAENNNINVELLVESDCTLELDIRAHNIQFDMKKIHIDPTDDKPAVIRLEGHVVNEREPWSAVVIPNGKLTELIEVNKNSLAF